MNSTNRKISNALWTVAAMSTLVAIVLPIAGSIIKKIND